MHMNIVGFPELELQALVNCLMLMVGTKLGSFWRVVSVPKC